MQAGDFQSATKFQLQAQEERAKFETARQAQAQGIQMTGAEHDRQQNQPSQTEMAKIRTARTDAATLVSALDDYQNTLRNAPRGERIRSIAGAATPSNTAYSNAAMLAKGETLFNLGVLSGPDLDIIRRTLADPSTIRGNMATPEDVSASVSKVIDLIQTRLAAHEQQLGQQPTDVRSMAKTLRATQPGASPSPTAAPSGPPKAGDVMEGYRFKGGNPGDKANWEPAQ